MTIWKRYLAYFISLLFICQAALADEAMGLVSGKVLSTDGDPIDYAMVFLKGTTYSSSTNEKDCIISRLLPEIMSWCSHLSDMKQKR